MANPVPKRVVDPGPPPEVPLAPPRKSDIVIEVVIRKEEE